MAAKVPAKSILKTSTAKASPTISDEQKAKAEQNRRNLGIALYHANKIQSQKDFSNRILSVVETLVDFPGPTPTPTEAAYFAKAIEIFQPSDFDDLIEERRTAGKCGYVLCRRSPRATKLGASAAWKLSSKGAADYCSNACMRKALYVRTQLSETPAWEREPEQQSMVILDEEGIPDGSSVSPSAAQQVVAERRVANGQELALERGETTQSFKPRQVMMEDVVEKTAMSLRPVIAPVAPASSHKIIDGYQPKSTSRKVGGVQEDDDESSEEEMLADDGEGNKAMLSTEEDADAEESWRELHHALNDAGTG